MTKYHMQFSKLNTLYTKNKLKKDVFLQPLLAAILYFIPIISFSQQSKFDSLLYVLKTAEHDSVRLNAYLALGDFYQKSNLDTAIFFHTKAKEMAEKIKDGLKKGKVLNMIGLDYSEKYDFEKSLKYFNEAISIAENTFAKNKEVQAKELLAITLANIGDLYANRSDFEKAKEYYFKAIKNYKEIKNEIGQADNYGNLAEVYIRLSSFSEALELYAKALKIYKKAGNKIKQGRIYGNIGIVHYFQSNYPKTLEYYFKAQKIYEELGDKSGQANNLGNIGLVYANLKEYDKALKYSFKSLEINEEIKNKAGIAKMLGNIGICYTYKSDYIKALEFNLKSLNQNEKIGNKRSLSTNLSNIGNIYNFQADYLKALDYYLKALKIAEEIENEFGQVVGYGNIGSIYIKLKKYKEAEKYIKLSSSISTKIGAQDQLKDMHLMFYELYEASKRPALALEHYKKYIALRDSMFSEENQKVTIQKEMQFNYEKKAATDSIANVKEKEIKEIAFAKQKAELKAKQNQQYALFGGLILVLLFAGFVFNRLQVTKKQKHIITQQKHLVEEKHKEITDSINYAERIQRSFLATTEMLDKYLGVTSSSPSSAVIAKEERLKQSVPKDEIASLPTVVRNDERKYFVFFRPKDVVSGDFYWAGELNNGNFAFSVADSTGHGVPGAIMSILNISSLEKSIEKETTPDKILNQTRRIIIDRLKKDGSPDGGKDGMDCSLLVINQDRTQLSFAAANNPVFIVRAVTSSADEGSTSMDVTSSSPKNEGVSRSNTMQLIEFKPDKMPVGKHENDTKSFTLHTATLQKGDVIYALTDGFPDQFGGDKGKKFMIKNLKELLLQIAHLPMYQQEQKLAEEFDKWKGSNEQVDDVCIIGVRI